jgi:hypothetical protein
MLAALPFAAHGPRRRTSFSAYQPDARRGPARSTLPATRAMQQPMILAWIAALGKTHSGFGGMAHSGKFAQGGQSLRSR